MVVGIGGVADERGGERDARGRRETLQHRGEGEANERGRILGGEAMKLREHGGRGRGWRGVGRERTLAQHRVERPRVAEKADGPRADVFVSVAQTGT